MIILIFGTIGARLFHVLYEEFDFYQTRPIEIFKIWKGGLVFYGCILLGLPAMLIFLKLRKESWLKWLDFAAPICSLTYLLGRIGCFFNGCCYGKVSDVPWAIHFQAVGLDGHRHPTQLYAVFTELIILCILYSIDRKAADKGQASWPGLISGLWLSLHGISRIFMEFYRDDDRGPIHWGLSVSTWISLIVVLIGLSLMRHGRKIK